MSSLLRGAALGCLLFAPLAMAAGVSCFDRCNDRLAQCSMRCSDDRCPVTCNKQYERCSANCTPPPMEKMPSKCYGQGGKLVPCPSAPKAP